MQQHAHDAVTLGVQSSGDDDRTLEHVLTFRKLLREFCKGPYAADIDEFALILRIGGNMQEFAEGCDHIRRSRKNKYITVDIGFPSHQWRRRPDEYIRDALANAVEAGLLRCLMRLETDKATVDRDQLLSDFSRAKSAFLNV
jgi:hypothetical protein